MTPAAALAVAAISLGAAIGALLRWGLGLWLNALFPAVPPGTLVANLLGGYLVGVAVALFAHHVDIAAAWRQFAITGFLGGLTTMSTFSAEVVALLQQGRLLWAAGAIVLHVSGSLAMTVAGIASYEVLRRA